MTKANSAATFAALSMTALVPGLGHAQQSSAPNAETCAVSPAVADLSGPVKYAGILRTGPDHERVALMKTAASGQGLAGKKLKDLSHWLADYNFLSPPCQKNLASSAREVTAARDALVKDANAHQGAIGAPGAPVGNQPAFPTTQYYGQVPPPPPPPPANALPRIYIFGPPPPPVDGVINRHGFADITLPHSRRVMPAMDNLSVAFFKDAQQQDYAVQAALTKGKTGDVSLVTQGFGVKADGSDAVSADIITPGVQGSDAKKRIGEITNFIHTRICDDDNGRKLLPPVSVWAGEPGKSPLIPMTRRSNSTLERVCQNISLWDNAKTDVSVKWQDKEVVQPTTPNFGPASATPNPAPGR